jgi:hypothetical protein
MGLDTLRFIKEIGMNYKIRDLETKIIALLNSEPDVPIDAKRLILINIYNLVVKEADKIILLETGGEENVTVREN